MRKYYAAGGVRVAQRQGNGAGTIGLTWLLGDHLGSTSITASAGGTLQSELRYTLYRELTCPTCPPSRVNGRFG